MAMMGSATRCGRRQSAARCRARRREPAFRGGQSLGARGVLVNITASSGLKMKEYHQVMEHDQGIHGRRGAGHRRHGHRRFDRRRLARDHDRHRSGRSRDQGAAARRARVVEQVVERTGTDGIGMRTEARRYESLDRTPAVVRRGRATAPKGGASAFNPADIPAFLRKQAD
jgi:cell division protein FtsZ